MASKGAFAVFSGGVLAYLATLPPIGWRTLAMPATFQDECGACHWAYHPSLLPAASWRLLMQELADHFGENASMAAAISQEVLAYLLAHAADVERSEQTREFLQGVDLQNPPLRISDMPWFVREHRKVSAPTWQHPKVKSKANQLCGLSPRSHAGRL